MEAEDKIIAAIKSGVISSGNISLDIIRCLAISPTPPDVHNELNYGHAILDSQDQLNKYIYGYGSMIKHQCDRIFELLQFTSTNLATVDYACGQGFASMFFFDKHQKSRNITSSVTLIEPSQIALERSKHTMQCYAPQAKIYTLNKLWTNLFSLI